MKICAKNEEDTEGMLNGERGVFVELFLLVIADLKI